MPNDLFCLLVGSKIIADCGALSSGGRRHSPTGSGAELPEIQSSQGRVWAQKSEALIKASAHRPRRVACSQSRGIGKLVAYVTSTEMCMAQRFLNWGG